CRRLGSTPAWDGDRYVASPASGFARRVRRRSGRSVRLRPVLGSLLPGSHPTTSTTTHPSPTASLTVQTRQNQGWPSCGSSQSRSRASENHTVAINITGPCDDQAVLHHEMGLTLSTVPTNHDASRDRAERRASDLDEAAVLNRSGSSRPTVVFLCVHNAGRSQMAAGLMRQLARGRVDVFSGGSEPTDEVNPLAVAVMAERGIDVGAER